MGRPVAGQIYVYAVIALGAVVVASALSTVEFSRPGLFPALLEHNEPVLSFILDNYWIDIGTPAKYLEVHHDILSKKFVSPRVARRGRSPEIYSSRGFSIKR